MDTQNRRSLSQVEYIIFALIETIASHNRTLFLT
jgi:hypothetical protein